MIYAYKAYSQSTRSPVTSEELCKGYALWHMPSSYKLHKAQYTMIMKKSTSQRSASQHEAFHIDRSYCLWDSIAGLI